MTRDRYRMMAPGRATLCTALLMAVVPATLGQDWIDHYTDAEDALNAQEWERAVQQLDLAISKLSQPEILAGWKDGRRVDYHPYLKLGIAYYNLGKYDLALQAFETEVNWGAITKASWKQPRPDMRNLQRFKQLALEAKAAAARSEQERIDTVVTVSLKEAALLEKQGRWAEALGVVGNALAVKPGHQEAETLMARLRSRMDEAERRRNLELRVAGLVEQGKDRHLDGNYLEAASFFQQAYSLLPGDDIQARLEASQESLRAGIQAEQDAAQRRSLIDTALGDAARLEGEGQFVVALDRLQSVLALEPDHAEAGLRQGRLLGLQAERERRQLRQDQIDRLVRDGTEHLDRGAYADAVATFNRVIGMDPDSLQAQAALSQAYSSLSTMILESSAPIVAMLPPMIALLNQALTELPAARTEGEEPGSAESALPEEKISSASFVLSGNVFDDDPEIRLAYFRADDAPGAAAAQTAVLTGERMGDRLYRFQFSRSYTLDPGVARWRVVATDVDGLTAEAVHQVNYIRPWTRSPWLYGAALALAAVAVASHQGVRTYHRRQLRKRRFNPYIAGAPVLGDDMFFGRERLMSRVLQTIHNNSILLYGERRIGKTSFQHHLKQRLECLDDPQYRFYPVFIDLQGTPQEQFFYTLAEGIYEGLDSMLRDLAEESRFAQGLPYEYQTFVRDLRLVLKRLRERSDRKMKLVLLIDEVDQLNDYDPRINQKLRSLFMKSFAEDLVAVVSGVQIKKHWSSEGSPWYNFFEEVPVKPFQRQDAEELIARPIEGIFRLESGVVDRIIDTAECRPYIIQKMCVELVNRAHSENRARITLGDVEALDSAEA